MVKFFCDECKEEILPNKKAFFVDASAPDAELRIYTMVPADTDPGEEILCHGCVMGRVQKAINKLDQP